MIWCIRPWFIYLNLGLFICLSCSHTKVIMKKEVFIKKLTHSPNGHMLHHNSVFAADSQWIVFDGRNDDTKIGETSTIGIVNVVTGEESEIYQTTNQTKYGPGVGAASFSPTENIVVFIHGLNDANQDKPYDITRRFAMAVAIDNPHQGIPMDARDIIAPYTAGSLRGGTHSHCWSPDGTMLSFTYNDEFVDADLRNVGVMITTDSNVTVPDAHGNYNGQMYAVLISTLQREPKWGSNEISKAFDECWVGADAAKIAFQGHTRNEKGEVITEIYTVDIDANLILADAAAVGIKGTLPQVPKGIIQKRLSYTKKGLSDLRHWLRSSADGSYIYALAKDNDNKNQIVQCTVATGEFKYLTDYPFSISSPINIDANGDKITFVANNNVYLYDIQQRQTTRLTDYTTDDPNIVGAPVFGPKDNVIAFNQFETLAGHTNVQILLIYY